MTDSSRIGLDAAIDRIVRSRLAAVRVCVDAEVVSYDAAAQTVVVRVLVADPKVEAGVEGWRDVPSLEVPVRWPVVAGASLTARIEPEDRGVLHIRDRSHDEVDSGQGSDQTRPASVRRWDYSDAYFVAGYDVPAGASRHGADPTVWLDTGRAVRVGSATASQKVALAAEVFSELQAVQTTLLSVVGATFATPYVPGAVGSDRLYTDG